MITSGVLLHQLSKKNIYIYIRPKLNFHETHSYGINTPTTAELKLLLDIPECRGGAEKK